MRGFLSEPSPLASLAPGTEAFVELPAQVQAIEVRLLFDQPAEGGGDGALS